jgi:hypothetical protein
MRLHKIVPAIYQKATADARSTQAEVSQQSCRILVLQSGREATADARKCRPQHRDPEQAAASRLFPGRSIANLSKSQHRGLAQVAASRLYTGRSIAILSKSQQRGFAQVAASRSCVGRSIAVLSKSQHRGFAQVAASRS